MAAPGATPPRADAELLGGYAPPTIVCFCPVPPPVTGQAAVSEEAIKLFRDQSYAVKVINKLGMPGLRRYWLYFRSLPVMCFALLAGPRPALAYLTCSRSRSGFLRDAVFIALCRLRGIPAINHVHGSDITLLLDDPWVGRLARRLLNSLHANIVLSEGMANECRAHGLAHTVVVPNFAPTEFFESRRRDAGRRCVRVLYYSNVMESKGIFDLIEACSILHSGRAGASEPFELEVVGPVLENDLASARRTRDRFLAALERMPFIRWRGPLYGEDKLRAYQDADVYCLPSYYPEGAPLSLLEAMAVGLPPVVTPIGSVPEIVQEGRSGFFVPARQPAELAERLRSLIASADLRRELGAGARERARSEYTLAAFRNALGAVLKSARAES